jgi:hexosaminidase
VCPFYTPWATFANEPPAGQLRITDQNTTQFTADLLSAVADMFPSMYFSTGGDEINLNCYSNDTQTQATLNSTGQTFEQALSNFTEYTHQAIIAKGKTPMVWEGSLLYDDCLELRSKSCLRDGSRSQCNSCK